MLVGAASSSLHSEGAAPASDWGGWEAAGWVPRSGDGNGFAVQHADDARLLAEHGLGSWRITLEWARLEPRATGRLDVDEVARYRRVLQSIRAAGLQAWACLAHTTLPGWFSEDERGFLDDRMARRVWPAHVDRVAEAFGDLVDGWITFHEPVRYVLDGYLLGRMPPGRTDGDDARAALRHLLAADAEAARLLKGKAPVSSCHWLPPVRGPGAAAATALIWDSWRDHDDHDLVGVSCANGVVVDADGGFSPWPSGPADALAESLHRVADERAGRPFTVLTGAAGRDADERETITKELDAALHEAAAAGVTIEHAHWWSAVDGYEGWLGFEVTSGLFDRDRNPTGIAWITTPPAPPATPDDRD